MVIYTGAVNPESRMEYNTIQANVVQAILFTVLDAHSMVFDVHSMVKILLAVLDAQSMVFDDHSMVQILLAALDAHSMVLDAHSAFPHLPY